MRWGQLRRAPIPLRRRRAAALITWAEAPRARRFGWRKFGDVQSDGAAVSDKSLRDQAGYDMRVLRSFRNLGRQNVWTLAVRRRFGGLRSGLTQFKRASPNGAELE